MFGSRNIPASKLVAQIVLELYDNSPQSLHIPGMVMLHEVRPNDSGAPDIARLEVFALRYASIMFAMMHCEQPKKVNGFITSRFGELVGEHAFSDKDRERDLIYAMQRFMHPRDVQGSYLSATSEPGSIVGAIGRRFASNCNGTGNVELAASGGQYFFTLYNDNKSRLSSDKLAAR